VLAYSLRHGEAMPARPVSLLALKTASREMGMSAPKTTPLLEDIAAEPGEEDARVSEVRDVTAGLAADGTFTWQAPAGEWEILRVGYTANGARASTR